MIVAGTVAGGAAVSHANSDAGVGADDAGAYVHGAAITQGTMDSAIVQGTAFSCGVGYALILISVLLCVGSLNLINIVKFQTFIFFVIPFLPLFFMFLISILAETNRAPFDLPEAESELVSGFNVEYSSMGFALFFLAEYSSIIVMSILATHIFLGG